MPKQDKKGSASELDLGPATIIFDVKDVQKSIDFYTRLGFEQTIVRGHDGSKAISSKNNPDWATFSYQGLNLHLMRIGTDMMNFQVPDIEATREALSSRGLDHKPAGPHDTGITLMDPDGNVVYIMPERGGT